MHVSLQNGTASRGVFAAGTKIDRTFGCIRTTRGEPVGHAGGVLLVDQAQHSSPLHSIERMHDIIGVEYG
jgi:hypothetical protein